MTWLGYWWAHSGLPVSASSPTTTPLLVVATTTPSLTAPAAPTGLAVADTTYKTVTIAWTDNANNETGYVVERKIGANPFVQIALASFNATNYTDAGLDYDTTYTYRVAATNSLGLSAYTAEVDATTEPPPLT